MPAKFPFLTAYDPPGSSEGTLDPLGLYQIADQLAVHLVPAVRERMQRIRFLTAMAVGSMITEDLEDDLRHRDASPFLVWEWLVVEALIRTMDEDPTVWGVPGTQVTRRAIREHGYLDARSYLKTPRIFGFHGVYKRLAIHLDLLDVHLGQGPEAEGLVDAWAKGLQLGGGGGAQKLLSHWRDAVRRSLDGNPSRTRPNWSNDDWQELANAFSPGAIGAREKKHLRRLLLTADGGELGALPFIWELHEDFEDEDFSEEILHRRLEDRAPSLAPLLQAIRGYELFGRRLQDAFDLLKAEAASRDARGYHIPAIARDPDFQKCTHRLHQRCAEAHEALGEVGVLSLSIQNSFGERFGPFAEAEDPAECALQLCVHHENIQRAKSSAGKRPWFDRIGQDRIYVRQQYREPRREIRLGSYVHDYRGWPIRRFRGDLT